VSEGGRDGWWPQGPGDDRGDRRGREGRDTDGRGEDELADRGGEAGDQEGVGREGADPRAGKRPPLGLQSRDRPKVASRYSLFVGLAFVVIALVAVLNALQSDEGGILGSDRAADRGAPLPQFAAPDVLSGVVADANIDQDDCDGSRNPCPAEEVRVPACRVEATAAIRVCDLFDRPLALSFWFTRGGDCIPTQDAFDEIAASRSADANFLSVNVLDDRDGVEEIVRARGWRVPVAHDADGAVSNIYGVGVCPTILLAYPGGILHAAEIKPGNFDAAELDAMVDELVRASAQRERRQRDQGA
jgi:hypothetical protein